MASLGNANNSNPPRPRYGELDTPRKLSEQKKYADELLQNLNELLELRQKNLSASLINKIKIRYQNQIVGNEFFFLLSFYIIRGLVVGVALRTFLCFHYIRRRRSHFVMKNAI